MSFQEYKIAAGYDNEAELQNVEYVIPGYSDRISFYPRGRGNFDEGIMRTRSDGSVYFTGYQSFTWPLDFLSYSQWIYLQTNYCSGGTGLSGKVTVSTRLPNGTYANYNAVMILPKLKEADKLYGGIKGTEIKFLWAEAT
jgi:hypothetical protein